jgi:hypothetical protein
MSCTVDYEKRKQMLDDIKLLSKDQYEEIFRIIKRNNVEYTENSNGIFFDLNNVMDDTIEKIFSFLDYCKAQKKSEEERTNELECLKHETTESQK